MIRLTEKEELVMKSIWEIASPFSIRDLSSPYPYTTVASIVKNLQMKGYVSIKTPMKATNRYLYNIVISKDDYILNNLRNLLSDFCGYKSHVLIEFVMRVLCEKDE